MPDRGPENGGGRFRHHPFVVNDQHYHWLNSGQRAAAVEIHLAGKGLSQTLPKISVAACSLLEQELDYLALLRHHALLQFSETYHPRGAFPRAADLALALGGEDVRLGRKRFLGAKREQRLMATAPRIRPRKGTTP